MPMEYSRVGLKSWSWAIAEVFAANGSGHILTCCERHFPLEITDNATGDVEVITADSDQVSPIFASDEMDYYPSCDVCGATHDYVSLTSDGVDYELEAIDNQIARTANPIATQELYERRDEFISRYGLEE